MTTANNIQHQGGQHRPATGVSTWDNETDAERRERRRRAHAELDAIEATEEMGDVDPGWLREFEAAVNDAVDAGEFDVPF